MAPETVLALSAFLAVSSATLLIYLTLCKPAARPGTRGDDLADPQHDPFYSPAPLKTPVTRPASAPREMSGVGGGGWRLFGPIAVIAAMLVPVCLLQVARVMIRRQFEQVVAKITSNEQAGIDLNGNDARPPDFRLVPLPAGDFRPDRFRGFGPSPGFGGRGSSAPVSRGSFRLR